MNKLIIVDGKTEYPINTSQDLYELYNGWLIDYGDASTIVGSYDYEVVSHIRDHYQFIFDNIKKTKYDISKFEATAFGMP